MRLRGAQPFPVSCCLFVCLFAGIISFKQINKHMKKALVFAAFVALLFAACKKDPVDERYFPRVKEIIQANCMSCHSPGGQGLPVIFETDEDITSRAASIKSATIDPASPQNKRMPLDGELSQADKDVILKWFEKGGRATD